MMSFPITELLSVADCYQYLLELLHPTGLDAHATPFWDGHQLGLPRMNVPHGR